jgi:sterol desaturase/sphingolipid hydroxylase (fatty acid hydroxylase superfamily)
LILISTLVFLFLERKFPGRELPVSKGWYFRSIAINLVQFLLIGLSGITWNKYFRDQSLLHLGSWSNPIVEGFVYWVIGTFVFYWWHRLRHANGFFADIPSMHQVQTN